MTKQTLLFRVFVPLLGAYLGLLSPVCMAQESKKNRVKSPQERSEEIQKPDTPEETARTPTPRATSSEKAIHTTTPGSASIPAKPSASERTSTPARTALLSSRSLPSRTMPPARDLSVLRKPATQGEIVEAQQIGARLQAAVRSGALVLRSERPLAQIKQVAALAGQDAETLNCLPFDMALLRTLDRLTAASTPEKPFVVSSLYRPLTSGRPHEPHGQGLAVDIVAFGGCHIHSSNPKECVEGVLAIVERLEPGTYRLGLPRPLDGDKRYTAPGGKGEIWPFFPPPTRMLSGAMGTERDVQEIDEDTARGIRENADGDSEEALNRAAGSLTAKTKPSEKSVRVVLRWEKQRYAPLADVGSRQVRSSIEQAIARGANVHSLFPDGPDHLHLDVKPRP